MLLLVRKLSKCISGDFSITTFSVVNRRHPTSPTHPTPNFPTPPYFGTAYILSAERGVKRGLEAWGDRVRGTIGRGILITTLHCLVCSETWDVKSLWTIHMGKVEKSPRTIRPYEVTQSFTLAKLHFT